MIVLKIFFFLILLGLVMLVIRIAPTLWRFWQLFKSWQRLDVDMENHRRQTRQENGGNPTVSDRRDPAKSNRKIIPADEGEYVDYVEEE